jgi:hypothetical protein
MYAAMVPLGVVGAWCVVVMDFVFVIPQDKDVDSKPYPREIMTWTADAVYTPVFEKLLPATSDDKVVS